MKAIKNEVEMEGFRRCHIRDGAALARYFAWLEEQLQNGAELTESQGADQLEKFRSYVPATTIWSIIFDYFARELDLFRGLSFTTISSTGPNGGKSRFDNIIASFTNNALSYQLLFTILLILPIVQSF